MRILSILSLSLAIACTGSTAESDRDLDGIMDVSDACPDAAESPNQIDDLDGCPEPETYTTPTADPIINGAESSPAVETPVTPEGTDVVVPAQVPSSGN